MNVTPSILNIRYIFWKNFKCYLQRFFLNFHETMLINGVGSVDLGRLTGVRQ